MTNTTIHEALDWRYAVKQFDPSRKLSDTDWRTLSEALVKAPSSYGLQPWRFLVIQSPALREKLREVSWNQSQVTDASHFVVFLSRDSVTEADLNAYLRRIAEVRSVSEETLAGFRQMLSANLLQGLPEEKALAWTQRQAYIAMGFLLETAALLKIDSTPMEGLDPAAYDQILNLAGSGWRSVAAVALGYRSPLDGNQHLKKVRFQEEIVVQYR